MTRFLLLAVLLGTVFNLKTSYIVELTYQEQILECKVVNVLGLPIFNGEACTGNMYINYQKALSVQGLNFQYTYTDLIPSIVSCEAQCENTSHTSNTSVVEIKINGGKKEEVKYNKTLVGLFIGAGVAMVLLITCFVVIRVRRKRSAEQYVLGPPPAPSHTTPMEG